MLKKLLLFLVLLVGVIQAQSQNKYWVFFTDKDGVEFNPANYFDDKAITRRLKAGISLFDSTDFPLNNQYVSTVESLVDSSGFQSRWFNAMVVYANEYQMFDVENLPFVKGIKPVQILVSNLADVEQSSSKNKNNVTLKLLLDQQIKSMEGHLFDPLDIKGQGVRIAIFDGGFPNVNKRPEFKHLFDNNRIKGTYDFTKNKDAVFYSNGHGTMVLSNIAGIWNGEKVGLATEAEFLLAKTEVTTEPFVEEEYWLAAAEWADKNGADIINSSLGYTYHRYFIEDMDGTSFIAKAANMAFKKGILVVNAAGNDGDSKSWKYIGTPADAENVLSVGGIDPNTGYHIDFSSYGPTADGRFKPNVSAMGHTLVVSKKGVTEAYGTSFSSPLVAGFAACVLQMNPNYTAQDLFREIQQSASLYPYYDYAHGYGIPKASYFTHKKQTTPASFRTEQNDEGFQVVILENISHKQLAQNYLYYHIADAQGKLKQYQLIEVLNTRPLIINSSAYQKGDCIKIHYQGYTKQIDIQ